MLSVFVVVWTFPVRVPNSMNSVPMAMSMRPLFNSGFRMFGSLFRWVRVVI